MSAASQDVLSGECKSTASRRKHRRETLTWALVYVEFGQDNGGIVLNLGENGIAVQAAMPLVGDTFPDMRLKGGCDRGWTPVIGRLVWMGENRKTAGIQFVDLSTEARRRITSWIALEHPQQVTEQATNGNSHPPNVVANETPRRETKLPPSANGRNSSNAAPNNRLFGVDATPASPRGQKYWYRQRSRTKLIPANWNIRATAIILLGAVLFGAGLMLGAGLLGRMTKVAKDLTSSQAQQIDANADASKMLDNQSAVTTPDSSLLKLLSPPASTIGPRNPQPLSSNSLEGLPGGGSGNSHIQNAANPTQNRIPQNAVMAPRPPAVPQTTRSAPVVSGQSSPVAKFSNPPQPAVVAEKPVEKPASPPPATSSAIQAQSQASSQPPLVQPAATQSIAPAATSPNVSVHSENDFRPTSLPSVANTTVPSKPDSAPPTTHANAAQPEQSHFQPVAMPGRMEPGHLIHSIEPVYPPEAKKQHMEGIVELRLVVATDGSVRSIKLVSGDPLLASAAMRAANAFRYAPATLNGQAIETIQTIDMSFKLKN